MTPVAWQYRYRMWNTGDWSAWSVPTLDKSDSNDEWEWRPLYAESTTDAAAQAVCDAFDVLSLSEAYGGGGATSVSSKDLIALDRAVKALRFAVATPQRTGQ